MKFVGLLPALLLSFALSAQASFNAIAPFPFLLSPDVEQQIDSIFAAYDNDTSPGLAIGIVHRNELVLQKGYGMANLTYGVPITEQTVFPIGSNSKQFTVFALLLLEKEGRLNMDDDIRIHLPELPDYGVKISLRQVANHTAGIRSDLITMAMAGYSPDDAITHQRSVDLIMRQKELNFTPGDQLSYSNGGYALLAEVVAKVSGKSFSTFMAEEVFTPLGMHHTLIMNDYEQVIPQLAESYTTGGDTIFKEVMSYSLLGSTGVVSTVEDMSKWVLNFKNHTLGNADIFAKMKTPAILNNGTVTGSALGQFINTHHDLPVISHGGATAGFRSNLVRIPTKDLSIIFLSNNANVDTYGLTNQVTDVFLEFMGYQFPEPEEKEGIEKINLKSEELLAYTGNYLHRSAGVTRRILVKKDELEYIREDQNDRTSRLVPIAPHRFVMEDAEEVEVLFQPQDQENSMLVLVNGIVEEYYQRINPVTYSSRELRQFTGKFYSEELEATYRLSLKNDTLSVHHPRMQTITLRAISKDIFMGSAWQFDTLRFTRNQAGKIAGFRISSYRSRNLRFKKVEAAL